MYTLDKDIELPLYEFYQNLIRSGNYMLGTDSYFLLIEALTKGLGLTSREDLYFLCKTILLKPGFEELEFQRLFDNFLHRLRIKEHSPMDVDVPERPDLSPDTQVLPEEISERKIEPELTKEDEQDANQSETQKTQENQEMELVSINYGSSNKDKQSKGYVQEDIETLLAQKEFIVNGKFYPIPQRKMKHNWRRMGRKFKDKGVPDLNLEATIKDTIKKGYFKQAVFTSGELHLGKLIILIDHAKSMIAFENLSQELSNTAQKNIKFTKPEIYYFRRTPLNGCYKEPEHFNKIELSYLQELESSAIIIISDANAALGQFSEKNLENNAEFLKSIKQHRIAWLNPMPRHRWEYTTAYYLSLCTPMFEIDEEEFAVAISFLRGKVEIAPEHVL